MTFTLSVAVKLVIGTVKEVLVAGILKAVIFGANVSCAERMAGGITRECSSINLDYVGKPVAVRIQRLDGRIIEGMILERVAIRIEGRSGCMTDFTHTYWLSLQFRTYC